MAVALCGRRLLLADRIHPAREFRTIPAITAGARCGWLALGILKPGVSDDFDTISYPPWPAGY
jgi:hypothetical protein